MRKFAVIVGVLAFLGIGAFALYWSVFASASAEKSSQKEVWTCPMHPKVSSDKPGTCPICGMNLVKRENSPTNAPEPSLTPTPDKGSATLPEGHASFKLSFERQQMIGVKTSVVERGPLFKKIRAAGRLAFDPELYTAQNEYVEAMRNFQQVRLSPLPEAVQSAEHMIESAKLRLKVMGLADDQIKKLDKSYATDSTLLVGKPGGNAWIYADIYESDLPNIRPGLAVEISAAYLEGKKLSGTVASVDRLIEPMTRTAKARILVANAPASLRPQSYVDVNILAPLGEQVFVPFDAVFDTGAQAWVFLSDGQGHFDPRLVTIKSYAGNKVAIASGLNGGERIVTSANFLIDAESRLRSAEEQPNKPTCPKGQNWDVGMAMCMPGVGQ